MFSITLALLAEGKRFRLATLISLELLRQVSAATVIGRYEVSAPFGPTEGHQVFQ